MNPVILMALALLVFVVIWRIKSRATRRLPKEPIYAPRVEGFQVNVFLHPRMSRACLFDHGVQYGKGFRRKEGPVLPHDAACRCTALPFTFSSSEVFHGALRHVGGISGTIDGLDEATALQLVEALRRVEGGALPASGAAYRDAVGLEAFPAALRPALQSFLDERYLFLANPAPAAERGTPNDAPGDPEATERA